MAAQVFRWLCLVLLICSRIALAQHDETVYLRKRVGAMRYYGPRNLTRIMVKSGLSGRQNVTSLAQLLDEEPDLVSGT